MHEQVRNAIAKRVPILIEVVIDTRDGAEPDYAYARKAILRHIDDVRTANILTEYRCNHCGSNPEFDEGGPYCCSKAVADWDTRTREGGITRGKQ